MDTNTNSPFLTEKEAAALVRVSVANIKYWRRLPDGLKYYKAGKRVLITREQLEKYLGYEIPQPQRAA